MNKSESKYYNTAVKMDLALISLLKEKPFDYITVSEICSKAGVNRSTFYLHYETIGDLLEETTRYILDDFLAYFKKDIVFEVKKLKECELDEIFFIRKEYLIPYLTYVRDNKEIFVTVLYHLKTFNFDDIHKNMFEYIYHPVLDRFGISEEERNYVMMYYLNGIMAIITEWIKEDCRKPIEDIIDIIIRGVMGFTDDSENELRDSVISGE